jgi:hypothetical protein
MEEYRCVEISFHGLETSVLDEGGQQYAPTDLPADKDPSVYVRITRGVTATVGLFSSYSVAFAWQDEITLNHTTMNSRYLTAGLGHITGLQGMHFVSHSEALPFYFGFGVREEP